MLQLNWIIFKLVAIVVVVVIASLWIFLVVVAAAIVEEIMVEGLIEGFMEVQQTIENHFSGIIRIDLANLHIIIKSGNWGFKKVDRKASLNLEVQFHLLKLLTKYNAVTSWDEGQLHWEIEGAWKVEQ